ncbi:hypothetical protein [uncultured Winogradskyella sp.]|uniref:hypothetical protein n=1 Tax=uncultured Winogradskyella sp. TaxID=395353 RepID=UPI00261E44CF|nr:hypothetical protein [uncultured Winogradskyella sp.]
MQDNKKIATTGFNNSSDTRVVYLDSDKDLIHSEIIKSGSRVITFEHTLILSFLHENGFRNYREQLIRVIDNVGSEVTKESIFKFLLSHVESFDDNQLINAYYKQGESLILKNNGLIHGIKDVEFEPLKDVVDIGYIAYLNGVVKVTKKDVIIIPYVDLKNFVWQNHIINRCFSLIECYEDSPNVYNKCLRNSTNNEEHYKSIISAIGNLIHKYKDQRLTKAIIINDENLSEKDEQGGSGKGLIVKSVSKIRPTLIINGKNADPSRNRFFLQGVTSTTCVISIDDPPRNVIFDDYFSLLTDEMTVEKKHKGALIIPYKESPKFAFTTNYTIKGSSSSHKRRRFDIFLNSFYNSDHTPSNDFHHEFFYDWDDNEWSKFDFFMSLCLQTFLKEGLIVYNNEELILKKLKNETSADFFELMEVDYTSMTKYSLPDMRSKLINIYGDKYLFLNKETSRLMEWVEKYSAYKGYVFSKGRASYGMWFSFSLKEKV